MKNIFCQKCGTDLSGSSAIQCPRCGAEVKSDRIGKGRHSDVDRSLRSMRFHQSATIVWFFAPPLVAAISPFASFENTALISFYMSPIFGAAAGFHLGVYLRHRNGYSFFVSIVLAFLGAMACPTLTVGGCAVGFRLR